MKLLYTLCQAGKRVDWCSNNNAPARVYSFIIGLSVYLRWATYYTSHRSVLVYYKQFSSCI